MLDGVMRQMIDPVLGRWGRRLASQGWNADAMTLIGLGLGLAAAGLIAVGAPGWLALLPLLAGRIADGLDGAIARAGVASDFGGYLDIVADFTFYGAVPFAFALRDQTRSVLRLDLFHFRFGRIQNLVLFFGDQHVLNRNRHT